jgi:hypothetical protein
MKFENVKPGMILHNINYQLHYWFVNKVSSRFISGDRIFYNNLQIQFDKDIKIYKEGWRDGGLQGSMMAARPSFHSIIYAIFDRE